MKNLTYTIALISLITISLSSFAKSINPYKNATTVTIVDSYIQATTKGNTKYSEYLFADDFKQIKSADGKPIQYSKKQMINFLKKQEGYTQNCETSYQIIEQTKDYSIAKVILKYPTFTRVDLVTMSNQDNAWSILQVATSYNDK